MKSQKITLVIGASENEERYSNKAIRMLARYNHPVVAIGRKDGHIGAIHINRDRPNLKDIDTVTLYLNPKNQLDFYDYIIGLNPKRIIFNPGTENRVFREMATQRGIETVEACTLVLLSTGQY